MADGHSASSFSSAQIGEGHREDGVPTTPPAAVIDPEGRDSFTVEISVSPRDGESRQRLIENEAGTTRLLVVGTEDHDDGDFNDTILIFTYWEKE